MALDDLVKRRVSEAVENLYHKRVQKNIRDQIKIGHSFRGNSVTIFEERPHWKEPAETTKQLIAQLRFDPETNLWTLYWRRHTGRWYKYENIEPCSDFQMLLDEIDQDPICIFWG